MNSNFRNLALWVIIVLLLLALFTLFQSPQQRAGASDLPFSQFLTEADAGRVRDVTIQGPELTGHYTDGRTFQTYAPPFPVLAQRLVGKGVQVQARAPADQVPWVVALLGQWFANKRSVS